MKRSIRLKEMTPKSARSLSPTAEYRANCNDTLETGPFAARVDDDGFLMTGNLPEETFEPIPIFGGSFVESSFSHERDRFISIAERQLVDQGNPIRLLNGGYSGSSSLHILHALTSKAFPIIGTHGKAVIFVGQTDTAALLEKGTYWSEHHRITPLIPGRAPNSSKMPNQVESISAVLSTMIDACRNFRLDVAWAISPYLTSDFSSDPYLRRVYKRNRAAFERVQTVRDLVVSETRRTLESYNIQYFEGQTALGDDNSNCFYDELHLNREGQYRMAAAFSSWLTKYWNMR